MPGLGNVLGNNICFSLIGEIRGHNKDPRQEWLLTEGFFHFKNDSNDSVSTGEFVCKSKSF